MMSIELLARFQDFATSFRDREVFGYLLGSTYPNLRCSFAYIYIYIHIYAYTYKKQLSMKAVYLYKYIRTSIYIYIYCTVATMCIDIYIYIMQQSNMFENKYIHIVQIYMKDSPNRLLGANEVINQNRHFD